MVSVKPHYLSTTLGGRASPDPLGELMRSRRSSRNRGLLLRGMEGREERRDGKEGEGNYYPIIKVSRINPEDGRPSPSQHPSAEY